MKKINALLIVLAATFLLSTTASAQINRFEGRFNNTNSATRGITAIKVDTSGADIKIQVWGKCHPTNCDWGVQDSYAYTTGVEQNTATSATVLTAKYVTSFSETILIIHPQGRNIIRVDSFTRFTDNSNRSAYTSTQVLSKHTFIKRNQFESSRQSSRR